VEVQTGIEHIVRRTEHGSDHAAAAARAFASMETSAVRISEIETFDGEPRRFAPDFQVRELGGELVER
jgi:hypothetical protein